MAAHRFVIKVAVSIFQALIGYPLDEPLEVGHTILNTEWSLSKLAQPNCSVWGRCSGLKYLLIAKRNNS